jgi:transposase
MGKFPNHSSGHKALVAHLLRSSGRVRVCLEASGNYSLDLALTLQAPRQVEVSVINPRRARRFAESLAERRKTDPVDARVLCEFAARMPWVPWQPPHPVALHLRALTRALAELGAIHTQQNNRAHAAGASQALPVLVVREMQRHQKYLEQRMTRLRREALRLLAHDPELDRRFRLMLTRIGIAETSALQILGELAVLPDMLDARHWVAFSGLDPRLFKSGKSVEKRPRISRGGSRHLRRAVIPIYEASIKTYSLAAKLGCKPSWQSCGNCYMLCLPCSAPITRTTDPSCAQWTWPSRPSLLALDRPEKERGFSAPLLERKDVDIKRESIMIIVRLLSPEPFWLVRANQSLPGRGSRFCYGIISPATGLGDRLDLGGRFAPG